MLTQKLHRQIVSFVATCSTFTGEKSRFSETFGFLDQAGYNTKHVFTSDINSQLRLSVIFTVVSKAINNRFNVLENVYLVLLSKNIYLCHGVSL